MERRKASYTNRDAAKVSTHGAPSPELREVLRDTYFQCRRFYFHTLTYALAISPAVHIQARVRSEYEILNQSQLVHTKQLLDPILSYTFYSIDTLPPPPPPPAPSTSNSPLSPPFKTVPMGKIGDHYLLHLEGKIYQRKLMHWSAELPRNVYSRML